MRRVSIPSHNDITIDLGVIAAEPDRVRPTRHPTQPGAGGAHPFCSRVMTRSRYSSEAIFSAASRSSSSFRARVRWFESSSSPSVARTAGSLSPAAERDGGAHYADQDHQREDQPADRAPAPPP